MKQGNWKTRKARKQDTTRCAKHNVRPPTVASTVRGTPTVPDMGLWASALAIMGLHRLGGRNR